LEVTKNKTTRRDWLAEITLKGLQIIFFFFIKWNEMGYLDISSASFKLLHLCTQQEAVGFGLLLNYAQSNPHSILSPVSGNQF
jgi:hypothetical protein